MNERRVIVVGGGAAGIFAAIACAEASPGARVTVLEQSARLLGKVRISGGGRCNVTNACDDPSQLSEFYPRGGSALLGPFHRFRSGDTIRWFQNRGVALKTEPDGRVFPGTDSSGTIVDCLLRAARDAGVRLLTGCRVAGAARTEDGFELTMGLGRTLPAERLLLATGGCRGPGAGGLAVQLGHSLLPPVPSLFSFHIAAAWLRALAGISLGEVELSAPSLSLRQRGPVLLTHEGLSGPAVLRLSAWGARAMRESGYRFPLRVNWAADRSPEQWDALFGASRAAHPARRIANTPLPPLPARLWEALVSESGVAREIRWAELSATRRRRLIQSLRATELEVTGKSLNQDEFVTCGGVPLREVDFRGMESRLTPGLHLAGELLDIDGVTGGFNFQAAWTTGWLAGNAMAAALRQAGAG